MQWYYAINGQRQGPVSPAELEQLVRNGTIQADTLVWCQGMPDWQAYSTIGSAAMTASTPGPAAPTSGDDTEVCAVSGKRHPKREMIQYQGQWISAAHRDEFFQRLREGVAQPNQLEYARFGTRFCAKFVDGFILYIVGLLNGAVWSLVFFGSFTFFRPKGAPPGQMQALFAYQGVTALCGILIGLSYVWFFLSRFEATPGKLLLKIKVVRADGSRIKTGRIIGRHFAEWISGMILCIGYLMAAFDQPERRALHDRICDTRVVKT
jgi:uncharacterized RDD family membrane protein YckC